MSESDFYLLYWSAGFLVFASFLIGFTLGSVLL